MKRTHRIAILVEDLYQVLEVWYPYLRFKEAGAHVSLVGTGTKAEYKSKEGYPAHTDTSVQKISAAQFDAVVIPGGYAPDLLRRYATVVRFVRDMMTQGNVVAAICHGGWVLASADIIRGKEVTSFYAIKDDMVNAGGQFKDAAVVVDKNLITSRTPFDLPVFCQAILQRLAAKRPSSKQKA